MSKWYKCKGNDSDVVLYSKVRLSRNVIDVPFPSRMNIDAQKNLIRRIHATIKSSIFANEFELKELSNMNRAQRISYAERQLISPLFAERGRGCFLINNDSDIVISLCDEDHIKLLSFYPGENLIEAYQKANIIDDLLIDNNPIAYSDNLGFLTSTPKNLGTGMKVSYALHIPALANSEEFNSFSQMLFKLGISIRPLFKGGNGSFYMISNNVTLGISEKDAINNLKAICKQIVTKERTLRQYKLNDEIFVNKVLSSVEYLQEATKLSSKDMISNISLIRLGIALGLINTVDEETISELIFNLQDANLINNFEFELDEEGSQIARANILKEIIKNESR